MIFRGRQLSEIMQQYLQRLVDEQVQERDTLEYKNNMYGDTDDDRREMLKDITSMANHRGGYLVIGIQADGEGIPTKLEGIGQGNHVERIRDSCLDNVDKRIVGLDVEDVQLSNGMVAVIVSIPESLNAPHMVTFKGLNQFWKRHGRQKEKMTIDEIGAAFEKRLGNLNRLDRFLFTRKAEILENIGDKTCMVISASPAYIGEEAVFDIHDQNLRKIMFNPPQSQGSSHGISCGQPYVTLTGLRADNSAPYREDYSREPRDYLEILRNGHIEYVHLIDRRRGDLHFASIADASYIVDFVLFVKNVYGAYLPLTPLVVSFAVYNAKDMFLATRGHPEEWKRVRWQRQHLELEKFYIENLGIEAKLLAKRINDRIWQAFHHERATVFDDKGNLLSR